LEFFNHGIAPEAHPINFCFDVFGGNKVMRNIHPARGDKYRTPDCHSA
jgi:hypothetical protein